ncbi:hypothetical protein Ahia01_000390500 [Argonauta hians]
MEWELSKENVLPRKNGRTVSQLESALQPKKGDTSQNRAKKQQFEEELRTYQGNDPLEVWFRYITWLEETNPKGGKDVTNLFKSCLLTFADVDFYKNDPRYVELWVKFANLCDNPIVLFEHMFTKGIGKVNAIFYESWASAYEAQGNSKKADAIYSEGIRKKAEPFNYLQRRHYDFQSRTFSDVMKKASVSDRESLETMETEGRAAFMALKSSGTKAPVARPIGPLPTKTDVKVPNVGDGRPNRRTTFAIHTDENDPNAGLYQEDEYGSIPFKTKTERENYRDPGTWKQNKISSKQTFPTVKTAPFQVPSDGIDQLSTPKRLPEIDSKALSVQKSSKDPVTPLDVITSAPKEVKHIPMYCKMKVYAGVAEFSFEELRALDMKRKHDEQMHQALVEKNEMLKEQQRQILRENAELMLQRQALMSQSGSDDRAEIPQEHSLKNNPTPSRELMLSGAGGSGNQGGCFAVANSSWKSLESSQTASQISHNGSNSSFQNRDGRKGANNQSSTTLSATEEMEVVRRLYCASLNLGKDSTLDKDQDTDNLPGDSVYQIPVQNAAPFEICEDTDDPVPVRNSATATPFAICEDMEDPMPSIPVRKTAAGRGSGSVSAASFKICEDIADPISPAPIRNNAAPVAICKDLDGPVLSAPLRKPLAPFAICEDLDGPVPSAPVRNTISPFTICEDSEETVPMPLRKVNDTFQRSNSRNTRNANRHSPDLGMKTGDDQMFRLTLMTDEITLGFGEALAPKSDTKGGPRPTTPEPPAMFTPGLGMYKEDSSPSPPLPPPPPTTTTATFGRAAVSKAVSSTPLHPSMKMFSLPDMPNISLIDGPSGMNTENTIAFERPATVTVGLAALPTNPNRTGAMSPIKERSNEGTHSSIENCTADPSHRSNHYISHHNNQSSHHSNHHISHHNNQSSHHTSHHSNHHTSSQVSSRQNLVMDPFSKAHQEEVLANLTMPLHRYPTYNSLNEELPILRANFSVTIGSWNGIIEKSIGKGGNGQIFKLNVESFGPEVGNVALKVMKYQNYWEFYVCNEIQSRLKKFPHFSEMSLCYAPIQDGYFYRNGCILMTPYYQCGTLLDFVNKKHAKKYTGSCEALAVYFLIELLTIVDHLHKCNFIHGDIKPDNIVIKLEKMSSDIRIPKLLTLIDFGEAIDMSTYPEGTQFQTKVLTKGFDCTEMKSNLPWSYQTDLFGIAGTIHTVLFGKYMNVFQSQGKWQITSNFQRKWNIPLWKQFFHDFLNIPSSDQLPNLLSYRDQFVEYFKSSLTSSFKAAFYLE